MCYPNIYSVSGRKPHDMLVMTTERRRNDQMCIMGNEVYITRRRRATAIKLATSFQGFPREVYLSHR